jgi:hypothetical protein
MAVLFPRAGAAALGLSGALFGLPSAADAPEKSSLRKHVSAVLALGPGSWAQARSLRIASAHLSARLSRAARCDPDRDKAEYRGCVLPALRSTSIGGQTTARLAAVVATTVPAGRCRNRLLEVQAANAAAGEQGAYLLSRLYVHDVAAGQGAVHRGLGKASAMAARAAAIDPAVCAAKVGRRGVWSQPVPDFGP